MTRNLKISLALVAVLAAVAVVLIAASGSSEEQAADPPPAADGKTAASAIRADSHRLSTAEDGRVTLVEFLDFECESCGALYPAMEQIRAEYEGRVTFAIRYFPLPSHRNALIAAQAVEAASRQGKLEAMYQRMFETQKQWGESQESKRDVFVGYARDLGLNMKRFLRDLDSSDTLARIKSDQQDGLELGVQSTPTLFLNDQMLELESLDQLRADIDAALAQ